MPLKILLVAATETESNVLRKLPGIMHNPEGFSMNNCDIKVLVTGVGSVATAWSIKNWLSVGERPDLIINAGIAGTFKEDINIGDVVMPVTDCFADSGIESEENFLTLFESDLADPDKFPYRSGLIHCDASISGRMDDILRRAAAITVNTATGSVNTLNKLVKKFNPDIETMEGATFFYICTREKIPFLSLRAISNRVESRNRSNWDIPLALENLTEKFNEVIKRLE
jgi:futalosine hydrolase